MSPYLSITGKKKTKINHSNSLEMISFSFVSTMPSLSLSNYFTLGCTVNPTLICCFFVCSCSSVADSNGSGEFFKHLHFALALLFSELELAQWQSQGFWYIILLMASLWFLRLYLHYLGQWLFLQAISTPVTK
jgi:hypothetical protein